MFRFQNNVRSCFSRLLEDKQMFKRRCLYDYIMNLCSYIPIKLLQIHIWEELLKFEKNCCYLLPFSAFCRFYKLPWVNIPMQLPRGVSRIIFIRSRFFHGIMKGFNFLPTGQKTLSISKSETRDDAPYTSHQIFFLSGTETYYLEFFWDIFIVG